MDANDTVVSINNSSNLKDPLSDQEHGNMITTSSIDDSDYLPGGKDTGPLLVNSNYKYVKGEAFDPTSNKNFAKGTAPTNNIFTDTRTSANEDNTQGGYFSLPNAIFSQVTSHPDAKVLIYSLLIYLST
ncbi:hypothetical protein [Mycoplasma sp. SG1]|uniref:hypothetical protein n=1 Tax=Mycoplasma sp. SG1 TaxID=2810348 RepID=UPI002024BB0B|nr:hypothetical protein [Mycoplasma sp. SG1]URM53062.1 hypothetical protein JRW51_01810 [Mycoplasma sp. SG1]